MSGKPKTKSKGKESGDSRFSVGSDPRFNLPKKKNLKSNLDDRFKSALKNEERFKDEISIDKYGRKVAKADSKKELQRFYNFDESDNEEEDLETKVKRMADRARGEIVDDSDEDDESSESDDSESEVEEDSDEELEMPSKGESGEIPLGEETSTIAVVNMDWDNIRAVDILAALSSFVPANKRILWVKIFPSEFGKKRMAQEELEGPAREAFQGEKPKKKSKKGGDEEDSIIEEDDGEEVDSKQLRRYQLQRLQYYYAIVQCDSLETARSIYDNCDGSEFESTANFLDLRYVPEGTTFDEKPHDECDKVPASFKPNNYVTDALQHSKVKLTWDDTPRERIQLASRSFSRKEIDDMDFKAYLASDSDEDEEKMVDAKEKYRALLTDAEKYTKKKDVDEDDVDMEITFNPVLSETKEAEENALEAYKRKEKERKKRRMDKFKEKRGEDGTKDDTVDIKGAKGAKDEKEAAELELLLMDDDISKVTKPEVKEPSGKHKKKKSKKQEQLEESEKGFDVQDSRFQALFENPEFAIDTTLPQFKKTKAMEKAMDERRSRTLKRTSEPVFKPKKRTKESSDSIDALINKAKQRARG